MNRLLSLLLLPLAACIHPVECSSAPLGGCDDVATCCNSTDCYFEADGERFKCDGKACDEATAELEAYCDSTASSS